MREPFDKFEDEYYQVHNVRVTDIAVTPDGIHIYMEAAGGKDLDISFPPCDGMVDDLCRIFSVPDLLDIKASDSIFARALTHHDTGCKAIVHLIESCGLSSYDYDERGPIRKECLDDPPLNTRNPEIFTMATIHPPPGMPWKIQRKCSAGFGDLPFAIINSEGGCVGIVRNELAQWIVNEAQIAKFEE